MTALLYGRCAITAPVVLFPLPFALLLLLLLLLVSWLKLLAACVQGSGKY
jgi:hypothetical protein